MVGDYISRNVAMAIIKWKKMTQSMYKYVSCFRLYGVLL